MPVYKKKQACTQADGDKGTYTLYHKLKNGILYLKGGDLTEELSLFPKAKIYSLAGIFEEDFFETKTVVYLPLKFKKEKKRR